MINEQSNNRTIEQSNERTNERNMHYKTQFNGFNHISNVSYVAPIIHNYNVIINQGFLFLLKVLIFFLHIILNNFKDVFLFLVCLFWFFVLILGCYLENQVAFCQAIFVFSMHSPSAISTFFLQILQNLKTIYIHRYFRPS